MYVYVIFLVVLIGVDFLGFFYDIKLEIYNIYFKKLCKSFMKYVFFIILFYVGVIVNNVNISVRLCYVF